jgi:hypothetical protein
MWRQHVTSVAQRVQGAIRTAEPGQLDEVWKRWPKLAGCGPPRHPNGRTAEVAGIGLDAQPASDLCSPTLGFETR